MVRTTNTPKTTNTVKNVDKFSDANGLNPDLNSFIVCVFKKWVQIMEFSIKVGVYYQ